MENLFGNVAFKVDQRKQIPSTLTNNKLNTNFQLQRFF